MKLSDKPFYEIIKYNPTRKYFGQWTPSELYARFRAIQKNPDQTITLKIGKINIDEICYSLANEMTYNPVRFGNVSPFMFNKINSILRFCNKYSQSEEPDQIILRQIALSLQGALQAIKEYCPEFYQTGELKYDYVEIYQPYGRENYGYALLARLRDTIKKIIRQNESDFKHSAKHRAAMKQVIEFRHPDLKRPAKNKNFLLLEPVIKQEQIIKNQMQDLQTDIQRTQMYIDNVSEYDNPGDTSKQQNILQKKEQKFAQLEQNLELVETAKQRILQMSR